MSKKKHATTLVVAGSGSGGHITPIIAVTRAVKAMKPRNLQIVFIGQGGDKMASLMSDESSVDQHLTIMAGKLRRYHGRGLRQLLDVYTLLLNLRDMFFVLVGLIEALIWLKRLKPATVFIKGGAIGVPLGLAAAFYKIPIVTHDSDAQPGLTSRLIAKWVDTHTVAMPKTYYPYPAPDTLQVGIPIAAEFKAATKKRQEQAVKSCQLNPAKKTLFIFGGSLGARRMNKIIFNVLDELLKLAQIVHVVGENDFSQLDDSNKNRADYTALPFIKGRMHEYMTAADAIITRGGATALVEIAVVGKPMIIIPNDLLTGGHQTVNAKLYAENDAAVMLSEDELEKTGTLLIKNVKMLLENKTIAKSMVSSQKKLVKRDSAEQIAEVLYKTLGRGAKGSGRGVQK